MIWHEPTHWPTHPPNHPPIHLSKGGSVSTNHKSSNRIKLSRLDQILLKFLWFHIVRPTNPPIHPPTHQKKHPPMGEEFSTDSKSSNGIKISWFVQVLSRFYWFGGVPPGGWVGGWVGTPPMHVRTRTHACTHTCTHTCMHVKHDKHGCLHGGGHLQFSNMFIFAFHACVCVHVRVHMSRDTPHAPRCPPNPSAPSPEPQGAAGSPNHQKFISPELIEIIRFCLKNLYLWTFLNSSRLTLITLDTPHPPAPPPRSRRSRNLKNTIKRERIEIIEFRLKICDPWALLHTYRLDLMCRWGGVLSQMALLCFGPKKVHVFHSCDSLDKKFLVFALDPTRPCLDWQLSRFLTSQPINEPFKIDLKWRPKWKIWLKSQFAKEPSTVQIFEMYPGML